ncbi:unnamed protein product, partial [marine sediment metagenome]
GAQCNLCVNQCKIPLNNKGFCGLRTNVCGKLKNILGTKAVVEWYYDPLPTNCVADWCCPGGTGIGYPEYSYSKSGPECGYKNLAVFYGACSFDCLFCQNWSYRVRAQNLSPSMAPEDLARHVDKKTSCICYFGGDPGPQMPHALKTSKIALEQAHDEHRILRICWETNGSMSRSMLKEASERSWESGGCIKFDMKSYNEDLHIALSGITNKRTLENFEWLGELSTQRDTPPFLIASTLLIPGYIDPTEITNIV